MIKILSQIDIQPILDSYNQLEKDMKWVQYEHKGKQVGLQYKQGDDPWTGAVGRGKGNDLEYTELNPFFKNTIFETIITKYNFKRTRLMWVGPYACYSMHKDTTPRIHIPLITNPDCYFVFRTGTLINLTKDHVWWVDTTKTHTFMNCSKEHRLHLVGAVDAAN